MGVFPTWLQPAWLQQTWLHPGRDFDLNSFWRREHLPQTGMDLGNGRVLPPEDVLEGHYRRLATQRAAMHDRATREVSVQVGDNLTVAITVLAPELAPLTQIAERVSDAVPLVEPTPKFRAHLHEALERTHRQHAAERVLGTRPQPRTTQPVNWWLVLAGLAATLALWLGWRLQQRDAPAT